MGNIFSKVFLYAWNWKWTLLLQFCTKNNVKTFEKIKVLSIFSSNFVANMTRHLRRKHNKVLTRNTRFCNVNKESKRKLKCFCSIPFEKNTVTLFPSRSLCKNPVIRPKSKLNPNTIYLQTLKTPLTQIYDMEPMHDGYFI